MRIADISTTLRQRFDAVHGTKRIEDVAGEIGITSVTLCRWLAQYRTTRIEVLAKLEIWIEIQEAAQQPATTQV